MPEIAEVRLIADNIEQFLNGTSIQKVELLHPEILVNYIKKNLKGLNDFNEVLSKRPLKVLEIRTKGKFCWVTLEDGWFIMITFGMSGNVRSEPTSDYLKMYNLNKSKHGKKTVSREEFLKHCHLKIYFLNKDGQINHFYYHDIRRFGSWTFSNDINILHKKLNKLGHDPLSEHPLSDSDVISLFRQNKWNYHNICKALMSQELIAGVGNFIKAETLYAAKIHPLAIIQNIPDENIITLYKAIKNIAKNGYQSGGASLYTYTGMQGDQSDFKETLKVYKRSFDPIGNKVKNIPEKQSPDKRSTFWVPVVQTIGGPDNTPIPSIKTPLKTLPTIPKKKIIIKRKF